jgi:N-acetylmuramidase
MLSRESVKQAMASEDRQLEAMANFLKASGLHRALAVHDWTSFARGYNGALFDKNKYDIRLAGAFQRFQQGPLPDLVVRTAQLLLTYAGLKAGPIDGVAGRMTRNAVQMFRHNHDLGDSDEIDDDLVFALRAATIPATRSLSALRLAVLRRDADSGTGTSPRRRFTTSVAGQHPRARVICWRFEERCNGDCT